ncbi:hypothetical protein N7451_012663 [Penicillium sp. IBT 35674x]|nr:hypothetical protein N7451_012663 [Penicillium sp. IBT 35674x]
MPPIHRDNMAARRRGPHGLELIRKGLSQETLPRSGPPKKLNEEDKENILQAIDDNPCVKYDDLLTTFVEIRFGDFFANKINGNGFVFDAQRLLKSKLESDYDSEKWTRVFWSDESTIERGKGARREYTFNRPSTQIALRDIDAVDCHKGISQMFWAAFSGSGRRTGLIPLFGDPHSPYGGVNRWVILELYQRVLPTLLDRVNGAIFQQDNASVHTAHVRIKSLKLWPGPLIHLI